MQKGLLIVLSGFSGAGKGTMMKRLLEKYADEFSLSISATTRNPREGEVDGREYFFKTKEEFESMIERSELLEYACYVNNYYGTPKEYVEQQLASGKNVVLEIEIQGALKIKAQFPETLLLFVTTPSAKVLKERLMGRGTETEEVIMSRMARAIEEAEGCEVYDYLIVNDDLETAVDEVYETIASEKRKMSSRFAMIQQIKQELSDSLKGE